MYITVLIFNQPLSFIMCLSGLKVTDRIAKEGGGAEGCRGMDWTLLYYRSYCGLYFVFGLRLHFSFFFVCVICSFRICIHKDKFGSTRINTVT